MLKMEEKQWDMVININLKSAFNFIHAVTPVMMRQRSGSIINMSSVVGVHGNAGQANYSASKAGMIGLAKSVALELGARGVRAKPRSWLHHHRYDCQVARGCQRGVEQEDTASPRRYSRGNRQSGPVPRQRSFQLCQRPGHRGERCHEFLITAVCERRGDVRTGFAHPLVVFRRVRKNAAKCMY